MSLQCSLPAAMEPFREKLSQTVKPFVRVKSNPSRETKRWESKVGGVPYFPMDAVWPCAPDGKELFFLAQINFAEIPALAPFPTRGIVQFFVNDDDLYGMDFDDGENQDTFRVMFHPDVVENRALLQASFPALRTYEDLPHYPEESYPLTFQLDESVVPVTDYEYYNKFGGDFFRQFGEREWDVMEDFGKAVRSDGHRMGGYAYFTQDDPRRPEDPMMLLLQLDSDETMDLMWGDMGVGHFFIREKDLIAQDFSRVLYDWDCL
ncbi:MAG: hypothetical protein RIQ78_1235 [Bacteroidota bacterium]